MLKPEYVRPFEGAVRGLVWFESLRSRLVAGDEIAASSVDKRLPSRPLLLAVLYMWCIGGPLPASGCQIDANEWANSDDLQTDMDPMIGGSCSLTSS